MKKRLELAMDNFRKLTSDSNHKVENLKKSHDTRVNTLKRSDQHLDKN